MKYVAITALLLFAPTLAFASSVYPIRDLAFFTAAVTGVLTGCLAPIKPMRFSRMKRRFYANAFCRSFAITYWAGFFGVLFVAPALGIRSYDDNPSYELLICFILCVPGVVLGFSGIEGLRIWIDDNEEDVAT